VIIVYPLCRLSWQDATVDCVEGAVSPEITNEADFVDWNQGFLV